MAFILKGETERFPARDGDRCEVCKGHADEMYLKDIIIGHQECLERNDLDGDTIGKNIIEINREAKEKAA